MAVVVVGHYGIRLQWPKDSSPGNLDVEGRINSIENAGEV